MAGYEYDRFLHKQDAPAYDEIHDPGTRAPYAGIYRCTKCGHEIGIAEGHVLPPQIHPQHPTSMGPIQWQLVVYAQHNK